MSRIVEQILRLRASMNPDDLFVWCGDTRLTFGQMDHVASRLARGLADLGVAAGDRVAIIASNRTEVLELLFACARLGATQVPLNIYLKGEFLHHQLSDCQAQTLIADRAGLQAAQEFLATTPAIRRVIALDDAPADAIPYQALREANGPPPAVALSISTLVSLMYTSGTTGLSKACMLTNGYYTHVGRTMVEVYGLQPGDVMMTAAPLFHGAARMMCVIAALTAGVPLVLEPQFRAGAFLQRAVETGATVLVGVGAMGAAVLNQPPGPYDRAHHVRYALWIPFHPDLQQKFEQRFGISVNAELYGQTECVPITYTPFNSEFHKPGSCGLPAPYLEVRLVDSDDREVPTGEPGEIVLRPREPHVMFAGYWNRPQETLESYRNLWYHTGDLGRAGAHGFITFVDRKKDAIRRCGENISSIELENAIRRHPSVADVAVLGVESEMTEDEIKACVVLKPDAAVTPEDLFRFFKETIPYFAIPRYVEFVTELPRNAMQRVLKHVLRAHGITPDCWDFTAMGFQVRGSDRRSTSV